MKLAVKTFLWGYCFTLVDCERVGTVQCYSFI